MTTASDVPSPNKYPIHESLMDEFMRLKAERDALLKMAKRVFQLQVSVGGDEVFEDLKATIAQVEAGTVPAPTSIERETIQWNILRMKEASIMLAESYKAMTGKPITMEPGSGFSRLMDAIRNSEEVLK